MKFLSIPFLSLACVASLSAADYGLGFSVAEDSYAITAPVRLKGGIVLEPSVNFSSSNYHYSNGYEKEKQASYGVGFGVYKHQAAVQSLEFFYGAAVSVNRSTYKYEEPGYSSKSSYNTIALEPAVGLEYLVNKNVSFGGKAGVSFERYDRCGNAAQENDINTFSSLFVRMYF